ncbi:unnamed protein product [Candida verbasci]|uniref:Sec39 domain-containing protein n=1 Tax=Candida verbasci TaxID=1227364 RepID=A0A9W4TQN7_9ASCO|nr:unnamed protein product [Candida verbasci]
MEQSIDANLYLTTIEHLSSNDTLELISHFNSLKNTTGQYPDLKYTNQYNILNLLLIYTLPCNIQWNIVIELAKSIIYNDIEVEDVEFENRIEIKNPVSLFKTADDLIIDTNSQAQLLGFKPGDKNDKLLFRFVQAKILQLSSYFNDVKDIELLFSNIEFEEFNNWYICIIQPFDYYWSHIGKTTLNDYLKSDPTEKFEILVEPFNEVHNLGNWIKFVIIPSLKYSSAFDTLIEYLFNTDFGIVKKYEVWKLVISALIDNFQLKDFEKLVEYWLSAVYYYSFKESEIASIEIIRTYDLIKETLNLFDKKKSTKLEIRFADVLTDFSGFRKEGNPLSPLFKVENMGFLNDAIDTCRKLYPINKLTLANYLKFKFNPLEIDTQAEVSKFLSNVTVSNFDTLMTSVKTFQSQFISDSETPIIEKTILQNLLNSNLFTIINEMIETNKFSISSNEIFTIVLDKFWSFYNEATNLNEKIGHLHESKQCLDILSHLTNLEKSNQDEIIRLKHLFKAINSVKNFKIVINKTPLTPSKLLSFKSNVLKLVTTILEQNPKSYLAFEKLFRITNDLILYSNTTEDVFNSLKTLVIESALIDDNFTYAYTSSIELFENLKDEDNLWLTFYQVGKFQSPNWSIEPIDVLIKQREILSLMIQKLNLGVNVKIVLNQWNLVNDKIEKRISVDDEIEEEEDAYSSRQLNNISNLANDIISDATNSTNNAGEKISNLFVHGLGWAIGANR